MRLNLGCGNSKIPGWTNVDKIGACSPDQVVDLEAFPWDRVACSWLEQLRALV